VQSRTQAGRTPPARHPLTGPHDITKERETAQALQLSEARYRGLGERPDVIYTLGLDGTLTSSIPPLPFTLVDRDEWIHKPFGPLLHPDDYPLAATLFQKILNDEFRNSACAYTCRRVSRG
jgi:hypothetical protein